VPGELGLRGQAPRLTCYLSGTPANPLRARGYRWIPCSMMRTPAAWRRGRTARPANRRGRPADARQPGPGAWLGSARLALGTASALGLARFAYGLLVPAMRAELGWSLAQAGGLTTANGLGYLAGAVATAPVARRLGVTATFRLGMVLTAVSLAATAATSSYPLLLLARAAAGAAGALVFIAGGVLASHAAARLRSAVPLTIYFAGAGLGIAVSGALIPPWLGGHPGRWPLAWAGLAAAAGLATVVSWTAARDGGAAREDAGAGPLVDLRAVRRLWRIAAAYLLFAAGYIAYITFLSAYLTVHHASTVQVAVTWVVLGVAAMAAPALWSRPVSRWPGAAALAASLAALSVAAVIALISAAPAVVAVSAIGYGATFLVVPAAITSLIHSAVPRAEWTRVLATFTMVFAVGQTAGPYLAGALADRYGAGATLVWTAALCAAGAALSTAVRTVPSRA
jgi:predicted MFS family arabinose efflux permease